MLDVRCPEEEEAEVVEVFPHIHHHPLPPTIEQLLAVQTQLMQALVQNQQNHPIGGAPCDKHGEFLKGCPPVFSHVTDPLKADDWLRVVEKQLNIAQCDN